MKRTILYLIIFIVVEITFGLAVSLVCSHQMSQWLGIESLAHVAPANVTLIASGFIAVTLIAIFTLTKWYPVSRQYIRTRPWGQMFWAFLLALGIVLPLTWLEEFIPESLRENILKDDMAAMLHSNAGYFVIAMLMPLAEEIVFRGAMITALRNSFSRQSVHPPFKGGLEGPRGLEALLAIVVSAFLFSGAHMNPAQMPHALIAGLILGWLYVRTGSIVLCFIVHWVNNSASFVMAMLFPNVPIDAPLIDYFNGNQTATIQAVLSSLLIALPAFYQLHQLTKKKG